MTSDEHDLVAVVLAVREELAPDSDAEFFTAVVAAEATYPDDPIAAVRAIEAALAKSIARGAAG